MTPELAAIIRRLADVNPLSESESSALYKRHTEQRIDLTMSGQSVPDIHHLSILSQPEDAFHAEIRSIDNDLNRQIAIVDEGLDIWFDIGLVPPPYYAWRVAVILAKSKDVEAEKAFLAAWCRHFGQRKGGRFEALADRAKKRGVPV